MASSTTTRARAEKAAEKAAAALASNTEALKNHLAHRAIAGLPRPEERLFDRGLVSAHICTEIRSGRSLNDICKNDVGMPTIQTYKSWIQADPDGVGINYARARQHGYSHMADDILVLADKTHEWVTVHALNINGEPAYDSDGNPILKQELMSLNSDVVAHKRLQVDTRKWLLSKVLPKIYGDKIVQEHVGANGGPIALAAVDMKNLTDEELESMNLMLTKAGAG